MLDLANNTVQGPAQALLADLAGPDQRNSANAIFCLWMAVGNILGFSSGASGKWHRWFPFLTSRACCEACGNLKAAFLVAVVFIGISSVVLILLTLGCAQIFLTLSWFPFFLFDTDWMGREIYHGNPKGEAYEIKAYDQGVRGGAFGLLLNSVVLGICSFLIEPMCKLIGSRLVWATSNFIVFACMAATTIISFISVRKSSKEIDHAVGGNKSIKTASLVVFALLGLPLSITYSVPFSVTTELTADSGGGQGLSIGVLNLAIVIPQDALFGGGYIPAFVLASMSAFAADIIVILRLPKLSKNSYTSTGFHFG